MAGAGNPQQPYGHQGPQVPQFAPPMERKPGSTAAKVWGILLIVFGGIGLLMLAVSLSMILGGGIKASSFSFNMTPEGKAELDRIVATVADDAMQRWTFWMNIGLEVLIAGLSVVGGYFLAIRPRPRGRKLAIARVLIVFLAIPVYGYENLAAVRQQNELTASMQSVQIDDMLRQEKADNPGMTDEDVERRRQEIKGMLEGFQPAMEAVGYASTILTVIGILAINGLLLFFMTRPNVKEYLESVATSGEEAIPNYDPSMGLMRTGPPHPGQASPMDQPPSPPEQQIPPV